MRHNITTQLPLQEHAILFLLPVLLIAYNYGSIRFKGDHMQPDIILPVYHTYDFGDFFDNDIAVIYADNNGIVSFAADRLAVPQPAFVLPASYFSLYDTTVNCARTLQLEQFVATGCCSKNRTRLVFEADARLPYIYLKQLLASVCEPKRLPGWCRIFWAVNRQPTIHR